MTAVTDRPSAPRSLPRPGAAGATLAMALAATALTLFLNSASIGDVMRGAFGDPDDAMRLVEVRNWLAGQSWFDMNAARLDPPHGSILHWSRLVDLPMAAMIRLFGVFTATPEAERLAAVAVPALWLFALYLGMMRLGALLAGPGGRVPALIGTFLAGATLVQFASGRIGHHAPETVALVLALGAAVAALDPRHVRQAALGGLLIALSLAMSLETLPFLAVLTGTLVLLWVWHGTPLDRMLGWLAGGLLVGLPLFFLLTVGPGRWLEATCDAYGAPHLGAGITAAAGLTGLAALTPRLASRISRFIAAAAVGALALGFVALAYPACLHSPFAGVDPLVRALWIDHVGESQPLHRFVATRPLLGIAIVAPLVLGLAGSLVALVRLHGVAAQRFLPIAALSASGLALGLWQVRTIGSATPIALCGGIYLASRLSLPALRWLAILPFCSTAWMLALPADALEPAAEQERASKTACLSPDAIRPLAVLPPGAAIAPIDAGSHLLEATQLSVFAAPYHRNNDGNRFAFESLLADPAAAAGPIDERHVAYILTCPGMSEMQRVMKRAPDGLAARLASGDVPSWLEPLTVKGTPYQVYRVRSTK